LKRLRCTAPPTRRVAVIPRRVDPTALGRANTVMFSLRTRRP